MNLDKTKVMSFGKGGHIGSGEFKTHTNELKAFPRLFIWFCRPDSVENANAVVLPQRQTKTEIDDDKGR